MPKQTAALLAWNRGLISRLGLARIDLARTSLSAEIQTNWMPRVLGSMSLRVGAQYIDATKNDAVAQFIDFVFSSSDTAQLEITDQLLRVRVNDVLITRAAVTAAVTNGNFNTDVTGWTDSDESGATSVWATGGYLSLVGTKFNAAIRDQQVTVNQAGTQHALRIVIARGPVTLRVGSTSGADDYISETPLGTGTHSLTFTPAGNFWIRLQNRRQAASLVDSVAVEASGTMEIAAPWRSADLKYLRSSQSGDVVYVACAGYQQYKIERRSTTSWSIVKYEPEAGPFKLINTGPITITPSATTGDITLAASKTLFKSTNVGSLYRLTSTGQLVSSSLTGEDQFTNPIRVTGIGNQRSFSVILSGVFVATVTLQYSVAEPGTWVDVKTWTAPTSEAYADGLDNQIIFYRVGIKAGNYTSGTVAASLSFSSGSATGIVRITSYSSETSVGAAVLADLGGTTATSDWSEGSWSSRRGYPSAVALYEGRLWWFGKALSFGSVSDDFENFDDTVEGDSGPITRSIGEGPVDSISWALPLQRLLIGTEGTEWSIRSSTFDEPLTPTNFNIKAAGTQGSKLIDAVKIDTDGVFAQRSGQKVFQLSFELTKNDYVEQELTLLVPELNAAGIVKIAVQRQPDTRIHCVRADGTVGILIFDRAENVICWVEYETDGEVETISVLPGTAEDRVYYLVNRAGGRYIEKWAQITECSGGTLNKQADSFVEFANSPPSATVSGLSHLEGQEVVVWADGKCMKDDDEDESIMTFTVSGGQISLTNGGVAYLASSGIAGLGYTARFKSAKQAFGAAMGTPLNQRKRIDAVGLILADTHARGLKYGPDFDHLDDLPLVEEGVEVDQDSVWESYDQDMIEFPGAWTTDSRVCLQAQAPRPCTVLACTVSQTTNDRG